VSIKTFFMTKKSRLKWFKVLADVEYQRAYIRGAFNVIADYLSRTEKTETAKPKNALLGEFYGKIIVNVIRKETNEEDLFLSYKEFHEKDEYVHPGLKQLHIIMCSKSSKNVNKKILKAVLRSCEVCHRYGRHNGRNYGVGEIRKTRKVGD
jgi:hypothetical protein